MGSNPAAPTKRRMLKGTRLFLLPPGACPPNATVPTKSTISTVSRYPTKPTKPTISTKSRFHDTPRKARFQRNQRNHDFTAPQRNHEINDFNGFTIPHEKHESNGFNESNEMPEKEAFRWFRCIWVNRDFVGNVAQARPKGAHTQYPKPPPPSLQICAKSRKSARGAFPSLQSGRGVLQCKALSLHHFITA